MIKALVGGATTIVQRYRTTVAGVEHMTSYEDWLNTQNGFPSSTPNQFDPTHRYILNGRDLGEWDHRVVFCCARHGRKQPHHADKCYVSAVLPVE